MQPPVDLIRLARTLGDPNLGCCVLAEGNVSARIEEATLWVKASGHEMAEIGASGFVALNLAGVLSLLEGGPESPAEVRRMLDNCRANPRARERPSTESFMHAYLLQLPGVRFVAHTHPDSLLSLACLPSAEEFAKRRLFPDEVVFCGRESVFVPYADPGIALAREIRPRVEAYRNAHGAAPKTIWLQNHGLITLGATAKEALAATLMSEKAARVRLGALQTGEPVRWLTESEVDAIATWPDEHYRLARIRGSES